MSSELLTEYLSDSIRLLVALLIGALIGAEREYRSKAAGFRTLILICVGSGLFTLLSIRLGTPASHDRIASNIITGIGFIGAGVIFKDGVNIAGLTTATSIWVTAALGMAAGAGEFVIAGIGLVLVMVVLALFERLQLVIDRWNHMRPCRIRFHADHMSYAAFEEVIAGCGLRRGSRKVQRDGRQFSVTYDLTGTALAHRKFLQVLVADERVDGFEY
jgi:putative Mg2+ transporter-C (MgtC) family protein